MHLMSYDLLLKKIEALPDNKRKRAGGCLNAIVTLERKHGYLEADTVCGNWGMVVDDDTVVFYYQIKACGAIEKYDTREALVRLCQCSVDLDYVDWHDWNNMLCAAFYDFEPETVKAVQYTYAQILERVERMPSHLQEFLRSCLRRVANFSGVDKNYPLWWFIYHSEANEFVVGYPKDKRGECIKFPYEEFESYGLF